MGGGGKGGSETETKIPKWLEDASKSNIGRAEDAASIGYMPYYGPSVAAFNPTQEAAAQSNINAAVRYGLVEPQQAFEGSPEAQTFAGGVRGYSAGDMFDQAVEEFKRRRPGQYEAYQSLFVDPYGTTGGANQSGFDLGTEDEFNRFAIAFNRIADEADPANERRYEVSPREIENAYRTWKATGALSERMEKYMDQAVGTGALSVFDTSRFSPDLIGGLK